MLKISDKTRAKYLLELREQGGFKFFYFIRRNKLRYWILVGYGFAASAYFALTGSWFFFWGFVGFILGVLTADLGWLRAMKKNWPFNLRVTNWDEVKKVSEEEPSA